MIINWNSLQPYKATKQKSFEQLCYQIAFKQFDGNGEFTPIDDSGGGDGVEFYLTLTDQSQWGWQAKYYEGSVRLNVSNRKQQIIKSLNRALEIHPKLSIWYLCLPFDLTPDEKTWVNIELLKQIPTDRIVSIQIWDESFIHEKINQPQFNGLKQAFFNELELSLGWFQNAYENALTIVNNKFDEVLYVDNKEFEYWYVNPILCNEDFIKQRIAYYPKKLRELFDDAMGKLDDLNYCNKKWRLLFDQYIYKYTELNKRIAVLLPAIDYRVSLIAANSIFQINDNDFEDDVKYFQQINKELEVFHSDWQAINLPGGKLEEDNDKDQARKLWPIRSVYREFFEELNYFISHSSIPLKWRLLHCLGNGGDGKTNFAIALVDKFLKKKLPAIFIPAIKLTSSLPLSDQILSILDIKVGYSFGDFLDCINAQGTIHGVRVPVVIDGLNEANDSNGRLNERLSLDIPQLESEFLKRNNLVLITTCRPSYKNAIWGDVNYDDKRFQTLNGFTNPDDKKRLVRKYFSHYKIQADLSFLSLERFTKPLYLKIYCETVNPHRNKLKQVTLGFDSIYSIFEQFIELCDKNVYQRITKIGVLPPTASSKKIASSVVQQIAKHLWEFHARSFLLEDLLNIADPNPIDYKHTRTKALLDEELLFIRNWNDGEEKVFLTYDLMAGYFIAKYLVDTMDNAADFFQSIQMQILINDDFERLHPNHEDILDGLCSLLPIKKGLFVHDLIQKSTDELTIVERTLFEKSIAATILLSPKYIPQKQIDFFNELSKESQNLILLIKLSEDVLFVSDHPFNFSFFYPKLITLQMNIRDSTWTEYVANINGGFLKDIIDEFAFLQEVNTLTEEQISKIMLVADFLIWTLTSTNNTLKSRSGDALYQFGIKFPETFFKQYRTFALVNDPTIFEWLTVILYNILIFLTKSSMNSHKDEIIQISTFLAQDVLSPGGITNTNHLITRNYAFSSLKLISRKIEEVREYVDVEIVTKKFSKLGIVVWQEEKDRNEGEYRDGNSLIGYYFNKDKMPYICAGAGSEYNQTPAYKRIQDKLRWRAYQLGYDFKLFGELDKGIANRQHWGDEQATTLRYADKYVDLAFLEYCGYLESRGQMKSYEDIGSLREFKIKHDPTGVTVEEEKDLPLDKFVSMDYVDENVSLEKWCHDKSVPNIAEYLSRNDFQNRSGSWVVLHSLVHQHKKPFERQLFFKIDTVFVKKSSLGIARKAFNNDSKLGQGSDGIPHTNHVHESEIPDADIIPLNEFKTWYYKSGSNEVERKTTELELLRGGKLLSQEEADYIWDTTIKDLNYVSVPRTNSIGHKFPVIRLTSSGETIEEAFERMNIEVREREITSVEVVDIDKPIKVFTPVRYIKQKAYICKNLINDLGLSSPVGSSDLFDSEGELASFNYTYYIEYVDQETFTYIRKDLLNSYLTTNKLAMFFIIWGERDYYPIDGDWMKNSIRSQQRNWAPFYKAIEYKSRINNYGSFFDD
jgi:hypothetical protein